MKLIALPNTELLAEIDDEDYEIVSKYRWHITGNGKKSYCSAYINKNNMSMHRLIMGCTHGDGKMVDHKDGNGLNNQKHNLRFCTHAQNMQNKSISKDSKYKGIVRHRNTTKKWDSKSKKYFIYTDFSWSAGITVNGRKIYLGRFEEEINAAKAYDAAAKKYYGEFSNLNFKQDTECSPINLLTKIKKMTKKSNEKKKQLISLSISTLTKKRLLALSIKEERSLSNMAEVLLSDALEAIDKVTPLDI